MAGVLRPYPAGGAPVTIDPMAAGTRNPRSDGRAPTWPAVAPPDAGGDVRETHSGLVVFAGDRAYKFKKAVSLGFLDFSSEAARAAACRAEVDLNRRLAPDVYLGVASLRDEDGAPFDHAVVMRRLPADRSLQRCLERGDGVDEDLWQVAHQVATLHAASRPAGARTQLASADWMRRLWDDAFAVLREVPSIDPVLLSTLERNVDRYLDGRHQLFDERCDRGRVVDGHGDLQCADVYLLPDGPRILDCIEFDESLRWGDGMLDAAFLAMDLERLGQPDLARTFLDHYEELTGDSWPNSLVHHHIAYRAAVRAKVAVVRSAQAGGPATAVRPYLDIAARRMELAQVRLTLVGGLPGTGKTTLATSLGESTGAVVLSSDEARADVAGEPEGPSDPDTGRYRPELRRAVYDRLLSEAEALLSLGEGVVIDASWADAGERDRAREVATRTKSLLSEVQCSAPPVVAAQRIGRRLAGGRSRSEATAEVARVMAQRFDPWPEATEA